MSSKPLLTGITLIRNGHLLNYPFIECISSLAKQCDEVIVNVGDSEDETLASVKKLKSQYGNITIIESKWNMSNTGDGRELAKQANLLLSFVESPWVLYLQADEFLFFEPAYQLKEFLEIVPFHVSQIELYRTYFWNNLQTRARDYEIWLGRIFRIGTHQIGGDGMYLKRLSGEVLRSSYWIYHYSRMGNEEQVTKRIRTLDRLFHDRKIVDQMKPFTYNEKVDLVEYAGGHPEGIEKFYRSQD
jgi:glycosyltransferase involved in cell wall biosynthesis